MFKQFSTITAALALLLSSAISTAADDHPAQELVENAIMNMLEVYKEDGAKLKSDPEYLQTKVDELIVPNIDFETMTRLAVSKFWRRADDQQKKELVEQFKTLLLNTYTSALTQYSGEKIKFAPFKASDRPDRAEVMSSFSQSGGSDVPVIYRLRDKDGWGIYDIEVNDISLVTSYRSAFSNEIEKDGIPGLIKTLKERNGSA